MTDTKSLSERLRDIAEWLELETYYCKAKVVHDAADALHLAAAALDGTIAAIEGAPPRQCHNRSVLERLADAREVLAAIRKVKFMTDAKSLSEWLRNMPTLNNPDDLLIEAADALDRQATLLSQAEAALEQIVEEKCDYMRLNNLGDPETQHTVKAAREVLAAIHESKP